MEIAFKVGTPIYLVPPKGRAVREYFVDRFSKDGSLELRNEGESIMRVIVPRENVGVSAFVTRGEAEEAVEKRDL